MGVDFWKAGEALEEVQLAHQEFDEQAVSSSRKLACVDQLLRVHHESKARLRHQIVPVHKRREIDRDSIPGSYTGRQHDEHLWFSLWRQPLDDRVEFKANNN